MALAPCCNEHAMGRDGAVVAQRGSRDRRHGAAGLVHQEIGGGKVPIMAIAAGEGHVERAVGNVVGSDKLKAEGAVRRRL